MIARTSALALLFAATACSGTPQAKSKTAEVPANALTIFLSTEIKGNIEPCGCTSNPLGDLARTTAMVAEARRNDAVLYLDGGSLLYTELTPNDAKKTQESLKARLLADTFTGDIQAGAIGLGPYDLLEGPARVGPPRQAANVPPEAGIALEAPKVLSAGGVKVGVFGVVDPTAVDDYGVGATDPVAAAQKAIGDLRGQGARIVIGLLHMDQASAEFLARQAPGIDFALVGASTKEDAEDIRHEATRIGDTYLFQPADRGQVLSRLDITVKGDGAFVDAIGESAAKARLKKLEASIAEFEADLKKFAADESADPAFVARHQAQRDELVAERERLAKQPTVVPAQGSWFTLSQIEIDKALACEPKIVTAKADYDATVGKANLAASKDRPIPAPAPGQAGFAGIEECDFCHEDAVEFWKKTKHAQAWKTLVDGGKQFSLECVYCHMTGFNKPGGSSIAQNDTLQDVQCEACHNPGSLHVDATGGKADTLVRATPRDTCITCHNELHSDTFQYEAYLRDVTGPGHGEEFRKKLGDGVTGLDLRTEALKKASATVGAGCPK